MPSLLKGEKPIRIFIKQEPYDIVIKRTVEKSSDGLKNLVIIEKQTDNKAGWTVDVTGCVRSDENGRYVEVIRGALKAIKIDTENKEYNFSKLTSDEMHQIINLKIFKAHYGKLLGDLLSAIKPYLFVAIILTVIAVVITGYNAYQINQVPQQIYNVVIPK